jgi:hypothetical protein
MNTTYRRNRMQRFCTVPVDLKTDKNGSPYYVYCGETAEYKVGGWYVCPGHKKYYTDPNEWPAEPLKGEVDDETNES